MEQPSQPTGIVTPTRPRNDRLRQRPSRSPGSRRAPAVRFLGCRGTAVAGAHAWLAFPAEIRQLLEQNGPAILAEVQGEWWLNADAAALATIHQPVLLVAAADSPAEFRQPVEALAAALPNARTALVAGGHLIDPAAPEVLSFIDDILTSNPQ